MASFQLTDSAFEQLHQAVENGTIASMQSQLAQLHSADMAELLNRLDPEQAVRVYELLPEEPAAEALLLLTEDVRETILEKLTPQEIAEQVIDNLDSDDAADVIAELPDEQQDMVLSHIEDAEQAGDIADLLSYDPDTAGGIMATELISVNANSSVRECVRAIRRQAEEVENVYTIYVVDDDGKLVGLLSLKSILTKPLRSPVRDVYNSQIVSVKANMPKEEVAAVMDKYDLVVLPVVDGVGRLVGRITIDDIVDVIREETNEDVQKMAAIEALDESYMATPFWQMVRKRVGWLIILFIGESFTATAMSYFEGQMQRAVILATFIPLIISSGGNTGSQASSLIIRALALGEVSMRDWWKIVNREARMGLTLGAILGIIGVGRVFIWSYISTDPVLKEHVFLISITIGITLLGVVMWGTLMGSLLPLLLKRSGLDPAASSAPFVATLVDVTGIIIYFSIAILLLKGVML